MEIKYFSNALAKLCTCPSTRENHFGENTAKAIRRRLSVLSAANNLEEVPEGLPDLRRKSNQGCNNSYAVGRVESGVINFKSNSNGHSLTSIQAIIITSVCGGDGNV